MPALALAQQAPAESPGIDFGGTQGPGVVFDLVIVTAVYAGLFKLLSRWPRQERWLVGACLLLLPPAATYLLWQVLWPVQLGKWHATRDTGIYWSVVAALLAMLWWLLKTRTRWLATLAPCNGLPVRPDPDFHRDMDRLIAGIATHRQA